MIIVKKGNFLSERELLIKSTDTDDGHIIDDWYEDIKGHMKKLKFAKGGLSE